MAPLHTSSDPLLLLHNYSQLLFYLYGNMPTEELIGINLPGQGPGQCDLLSQIAVCCVQRGRETQPEEEQPRGHHQGKSLLFITWKPNPVDKGS